MIKSNKDKMDVLLAYRLGIATDSERAAAEELLADKEGQQLDAALRRTLKPLGALKECEAPSGLADRTLAFIAQHEQAEQMAKASAAIAARHVSREEGRGRWVLGSLRDVLAVAASIMIVFLLSQTPLRYARQRSQEITCANQLGVLGRSFVSYAADNQWSLPYMERGANQPWYVGQAGSNTRNMFLLIRNGYARPEDFLCPAVPVRTQIVISVNRDTRQAMVDFRCSKEVGFSSRLMTTGRDAQLARLGGAVLMADRNPLFVNFEGHNVEALDLVRDRQLLGANSPNHGGRGQNVLRMDGSVEFECQRHAGPRLDDIYTIESVTQYSGTETPTSRADTFIAP